MTSSGEWGGGEWGGGSWGGAGSSFGTLSLNSILAVRENVFRLEFSFPIYFSRILDPKDGSIPTKYSVAVVAGSSGNDGNATRPLLVSEIFSPGAVDGIAPGDFGRFIDVVVDRPMTPHPALYDVTITDIHSADLLAVIATATIRVPAVFKRLEPPQVDTATPTRDFANPQTRSAAQSSLPDPNNALVLGSIQVDDRGDYAFDEGLVNLKKRIIRRLITSKGGFAHLPNYGVGIPDHGKRLALSNVISDLAADAESQISLEPDVAKVKVRPIVDPNVPGMVRFQVVVKPKSGQAQRFDVPFLAS